MLKNLILILILLFSISGYSQNAEDLKWWDPSKNSFPVVEGQAFQAELKSFYDRLPSRAEKLVRAPVWSLSQNAAGEYISFKTDAKKIVVRYAVEGTLQMPHFPATGVSGIDLYSINKDGGWSWAGGRYSFKDTIVYRFDNLDPNLSGYPKGRLFKLYLPLYNKVKWLEIGVPAENSFTPLPLAKEQPIVIYGTSIAQGGCASRPGMAWTSILSRKLDHTVVNLAFSGNGRLEKELIDMIVTLDAKAYVLDCLPNLTDTVAYPLAEVKKRLIESVSTLRGKHPGIPIILTGYATLADDMNAAKVKTVNNINQTLHDAFESLKASGVKDIYLQEVKLGMDDTVDGTHPNDLGMQHYAEDYEKNLRVIFREPVGTISTTIACEQYRDAATYDWTTRHNELMALNATSAPKIIFIGNSITHYWGGQPKEPKSWGAASWNEVLEPAGVRNFGYGWDRIENVLWRVYHGELDGYKASQVMMMIGTNNLQYNTNEEIITGLEFLVQAIRLRQPGAEILLIGLLPRRGMETRVKELNAMVVKLSRQLKVEGTETGTLFLNKDGKLNESLFSDGLHPNAEGYRLMANFLKPKLKK